MLANFHIKCGKVAEGCKNTGINLDCRTKRCMSEERVPIHCYAECLAARRRASFKAEGQLAKHVILTSVHDLMKNSMSFRLTIGL